MTTTETPAESNGVPPTKMFGTIAELRENGDLAALRFSARDRGSRAPPAPRRSTSGRALAPIRCTWMRSRSRPDHPTLGHGPTPREYGLHALADGITAGIATGAAARDIEERSVTSIVTGEIDVRGVFGIEPDVRKGFGTVPTEFDIDTDCDDATEDARLAGGAKYSAVFDMLTNPTQVDISRTR